MNTPDKAAVEQLPKFEKMVIRGAQMGFADTFGMSPKSVVYTATTNRMQMAAQLQKQWNDDKTTLSWPIVFLRLLSMSTGVVEAGHGFNAKSFARHGTYLRMSESQNSVLKTHLVPAIFELEATLLTDAFDVAFGFASQWVAVATQNRANYTITYGNVSFDIRSVFTDSMATPDREEAVDIPNIFEYVGTFKVFGFVSDPHPDATSEVQLLRKPVINVSMNNEESLDPTVWSGKHVMPILKSTEVNQ
jgi:hypothetical protein